MIPWWLILTVGIGIGLLMMPPIKPICIEIPLITGDFECR